jgi:hypothetical protein
LVRSSGVRTAATWALIAAELFGAQSAARISQRAEQRIPAVEARQGAASDGRFVYAIGNHRIGKYAIATGRRVASWKGNPRRFPHINSCTIVERTLVCAASNFPAFPPASSVEFFDPDQLVHLRSVSLAGGPGWLTAMDRHHGRWWAAFASYGGRGGQPGGDHQSTLLMRMDDAFRPLQAWTFPPSVLQRLAPNSVSGASWTADGRLTVSGHDRPELYFVAVPSAGSVLRHVATISVVTPGQAIDWDPRDPRLLWSVDRKRKQLVSSRPRF